MLRKIVFCVIVISLTFINYFNIIGNPLFPTWRILNILFVISSALFFYNIRTKYIPFDFSICIVFFLISIIFQILILITNNKFGDYEIKYLFSTIMLMLFTFYFYVFTSRFHKLTIVILEISIVLNFGYQIFQFISYLIGRLDWVIILNQSDVSETANVYRIIGPFLGPSGFFSESGQVALFVGPFLLYLIVLNYYKLQKLNIFLLVIMSLSLSITLSGGAFIHISMIIISLVLLYTKRFLNFKFWGICLFIILCIFILFQNEQYYSIIEQKIYSIFTGDSSRQIGASIYMDAFYDNFLFGIAPKSSRFINADPNTFIPTLLADHGIIAGGAFLVLYFIPISIAFIGSKRKFMIIPFVSMTFHLFLAYGTYSWSFIWIILLLSLHGLKDSFDY